jgi:hypothetical protein
MKDRSVRRNKFGFWVRNDPKDTWDGTHMKMRVYENDLAGGGTEWVAIFVRKCDRYATKSYSEPELREIAISAYQAWQACKRHRLQCSRWDFWKFWL